MLSDELDNNPEGLEYKCFNADADADDDNDIDDIPIDKYYLLKYNIIFLFGCSKWVDFGCY